MPKHAHQVAKYKREEKRLIAWLVGIAEKTYDQDAPRKPQDLSPGQLYERFVGMLQDTPEEMSGIAAPPLDVLQAGWTALNGRKECDRRMRDRLRRRGGLAKKDDDEDKHLRHRKHTKRLSRVVSALEKVTFAKTTETMQSRSRAVPARALPAQPFLLLKSTAKCP